MNKICDLHIHSNCSDGSMTPEELISEAKACGVNAVALCDHNTISGINRFINASKNSGIIAIPGVEVSCEFKGREVHILGLFLKEESFDKLSRFFDDINYRKQEGNKALAKRLKAAGYDIEYSEVEAISLGVIPNRVHFAKVLMEKGYINTIDEAFDTILSKEYGHYVPIKKIDALEAIEFLKSSSAITVLAHPFLDFKIDELHEFLKKAKSKGLDGMECIYSLFTREQTELAFELCDRYDLLQSGGSDFHAENKPTIKMGVGKGDLEIPFSIYEKLKDYANRGETKNGIF